MRLFATLILIAWTNLAFADAAAELQRLIDDHWDWYVESSPEAKTHRGDHSANDRWDDYSLAGMEEAYRVQGAFLERLEAIDAGGLDEEGALNHRLFGRMLRLDRRSFELGLDVMTLDMRTGPQHLHEIQQFTPFDNDHDYRMWLSRMAALPALLEDYIEVLRQGIEINRVQPQVVVERVPVQLEKMLRAQVEDNAWYKPFLDMPESIDGPTGSALQDQAREIIIEKLNPAYARFRQFLLDTYLPASRKHPGIGSLPGGKGLYEFLARKFTNTNLTLAEIHEIGKKEVARILAEMEEVKAEAGFEGDLQAFNEFLRTDPQFYYDTPEELFDAYLAVSKRLDPELVKLFGVLPRMPYGLRPIADEIAPDTTTAYYKSPAADGSRAGYYYVNLYRPEVRPRYEMEVLSVHEAVPGHHLQIALAQELEGIPQFRIQRDVTAFTEGWGLYSERLGYQMGLYQDPYSRYGQLTYDMWRAVRLVVDTGMHYFGWSRQQAIDYFKANAGKTETDIINEIDRYIGWPGQALAYKIGQLKILELRAKAEQALGEDFDIRSFHDELLGAGAIPLDELEVRMDRWLQRQLAGQG